MVIYNNKDDDAFSSPITNCELNISNITNEYEFFKTICNKYIDCVIKDKKTMMKKEHKILFCYYKDQERYLYFCYIIIKKGKVYGFNKTDEKDIIIIKAVNKYYSILNLENVKKIIIGMGDKSTFMANHDSNIKNNKVYDKFIELLENKTNSISYIINKTINKISLIKDENSNGKCERYTGIKKIFLVAKTNNETELKNAKYTQKEPVLDINNILNNISKNTNFSGVFTIIIYDDRIDIYKIILDKTYQIERISRLFLLNLNIEKLKENFNIDLLKDFDFDNFFNLLINLNINYLNTLEKDKFTSMFRYLYNTEDDYNNAVKIRILSLKSIINIQKNIKNLNGEEYYIHSFGIKFDLKRNVEMQNIKTEKKKIKYRGIKISNINSSNK